MKLALALVLSVLVAVVGALWFVARDPAGCYRFQPRDDITSLELAQLVQHASALNRPIAFAPGQFETLGSTQRHFVPSSCFGGAP